MSQRGGRQEIAGCNLRSVWTIATAPYPEAHFATFPPDLVEPCVLAGCPEKVCSACGAPFARAREVTYENPGNRSTNGPRSVARKHEEFGSAGFAQRLEKRVSVGELAASCECGAEGEPAVVLDPFGGSGTVAEVARRLGARAWLIEASGEYLELIAKRLRQGVLIA